MPVNPNPQGKGLVPVLEHWESHQPNHVVAKPPRQLLGDYLISLLILSANFGFKPVPERGYFLYLCNGQWQLSMIAPWEWSKASNRLYAGECQLRSDMTWQLTPSENLQEYPELVAALESFQAGFIELLNSDAPLEDDLPLYVARLPFYQRLLATGLSASVRQSTRAAKQEGISARRWLGSVKADQLTLLAGSTAVPG
ncbi:MAG: DUF2452 domain-containing protein [Halioglobus sp.]